MKIILQLKGYHIPGKKNCHYVGRNGRILIDKEIKKRIEKLERDIESQLLSIMQTELGETTTTEQQLSWIASQVFADDCWTILAEERYLSRKVEDIKDAGCIIEIEEIQ